MQKLYTVIENNGTHFFKVGEIVEETGELSRITGTPVYRSITTGIRQALQSHLIQEF